MKLSSVEPSLCVFTGVKHGWHEHQGQSWRVQGEMLQRGLKWKSEPFFIRARLWALYLLNSIFLWSTYLQILCSHGKLGLGKLSPFPVVITQAIQRDVTQIQGLNDSIYSLDYFIGVERKERTGWKEWLQMRDKTSSRDIRAQKFLQARGSGSSQEPKA